MKPRTVLKDETKATSQHQITIPKKIWDELHLKVGIRFQITLNDRKEIVVTPQWGDVDLSPVQWKELRRLAHAKSNVSRSFKKTSDAVKFFESL